ncbi:MAG: hypothetical protein ACKO5E_10585 [bacterium]
MISRRYHVVGLCFWPGLAQIWAGQVVTGLIVATAFGLMFNACVLLQWVYVEWADASARQMLWVVTLLTHFSLLGWTIVWAWKFHPDNFRHEIDQLFRSSTEHYLKGHWAAARDELENLVAIDPHDTEAHLRLVQVLFRAAEAGLAARALEQCRDTPGADRWRWEIDQLTARLGQKVA